MIKRWALRRAPLMATPPTLATKLAKARMPTTRTLSPLQRRTSHLAAPTVAIKLPSKLQMARRATTRLRVAALAQMRRRTRQMPPSTHRLSLAPKALQTAHQTGAQTSTAVAATLTARAMAGARAVRKATMALAKVSVSLKPLTL